MSLALVNHRHDCGRPLVKLQFQCLLWLLYICIHCYRCLSDFFVGIFFGFAHIALGESWSEGKFAQATASGIILGWLYFRFGLVAAILVHWATNYFVFSYVNFVSQISFISVEEAFSHSLISTMEIIFLISGVLSVSILVINYFYSKREPALEI